MRSQVLLLSDIHLGSTPPRSCKNREEKLNQLLLQKKDQLSHLILLGDIFEFWMEYKDFIPKKQFQFLHTLKILAEEGVEIHYFAGNHDFNLGTFFSESLQVITHDDLAVLEIQNLRLLFYHGDGTAKSDWKYRIARKVIRSPLANFCFKLLHPDWGMKLAQFVGGQDRTEAHYDHCPKQEYLEAAIQRRKNLNVDAVIHGHTHLNEVTSMPHGGTYVTTGQWLFKMIYTILEEGEFKQFEYD